MVDPLSTAASVVGLATAALQSVQFLVQTIDGVKGAPEVIRSVSTDLRVIQSTLQSLLRTVQDDTSQMVLSEHIRDAIKNCERACGAFRLQVEHWMERSTQDKMFWVDRWKVGLFGMERIKVFRGQLSDCKGTLSVALSTATVITTSRQEHLIQEMKDMMLQQNEAVLQQQIARAGDETKEIEFSVQQLPAGNDSKQVAASSQLKEAEQSRRELLHELEKQQAANQTFIKICEEALSQTVYQRTGQKIQGVRATNNSTALTGFINISREESKIDLDILDISADNYSFVFAGVAKNLDFKDLRPNGPNRG